MGLVFGGVDQFEKKRTNFQFDEQVFQYHNNTDVLFPRVSSGHDVHDPQSMKFEINLQVQV